MRPLFYGCGGGTAKRRGFPLAALLLSSCQVVSFNNGSIVYLAPTTLTGTGTYSVKPNGTGSLSSASISPPITFILAATNSVGISATALLTNAQTNGKEIGSGIAVRQ